jgi:hypothetical protein
LRKEKRLLTIIVLADEVNSLEHQTKRPFRPSLFVLANPTKSLLKLQGEPLVLSRVLSITRKPGSNPNHPFINLSGKWLKENGFEIGDKVLIEGRKGNLQIRAIQFLEQEQEG